MEITVDLKQKIIEGRKVVDVYRKAHQLLHSKGWYKGISEDHIPLINEMLSKLIKLNFSSLDDFFDKNRALNEQTINECWKVEGTCDGCPDRKRGCQDKCFEEKKIFDDRYKLPDDVTHNIKPWLNYYIPKYGEPDTEGKVIPNCTLRLKKLKEPDIDWEWK